MKLEETKKLKLQCANNVQTTTSHINNIQDSDSWDKRNHIHKRCFHEVTSKKGRKNLLKLNITKFY